MEPGNDLLKASIVGTGKSIDFYILFKVTITLYWP